MTRRALVAGLSLLALLVGAAGLCERSAGRRAVRDSEVALALGDVHQATVLARRAAEAAVPGSPYAARGYAELEIIARASEAAGRSADAAFAWRAMRSAAEATRPAEAARGRVEEAEAGMLRIAALPASAAAVPRSRSGDTPETPGATGSVLRHEIAQAGERDTPSRWFPSALAWGAIAVMAVLAKRRTQRARGASRESPV